MFFHFFKHDTVRSVCTLFDSFVSINFVDNFVVNNCVDLFILNFVNFFINNFNDFSTCDFVDIFVDSFVNDLFIVDFVGGFINDVIDLFIDGFVDNSFWRFIVCILPIWTSLTSYEGLVWGSRQC